MYLSCSFLPKKGALRITDIYSIIVPQNKGETSTWVVMVVVQLGESFFSSALLSDDVQYSCIYMTSSFLARHFGACLNLETFWRKLNQFLSYWRNLPNSTRNQRVPTTDSHFAIERYFRYFCIHSLEHGLSHGRTTRRRWESYTTGYWSHYRGHFKSNVKFKLINIKD